MPCGAYDPDVRALAGAGVDHEEGVGLGLDAVDDLLPRPGPARPRIPETGDVFMRAFGMRFCDASYLYVSHDGPFKVTAHKRALETYAAGGKRHGHFGKK
jgi:hypothetical protein